jgi:hypothetical protein
MFKLNMFKRRKGMYIVVTYLIYLAVSLSVTVWVARTLHRSGRVFLLDAFGGNGELADSVNHLLVVGFYLINVGYVTLMLHSGSAAGTAREAIELVCDKIGVVLLVLGVMHFFNLYLFHRLRKRARDVEPRRGEWNRRAPEPDYASQGAPIGKVLD